jgi:hypothetical protein
VKAEAFILHTAQKKKMNIRAIGPPRLYFCSRSEKEIENEVQDAVPDSNAHDAALMALMTDFAVDLSSAGGGRSQRPDGGRLLECTISMLVVARRMRDPLIGGGRSFECSPSQARVNQEREDNMRQEVIDDAAHLRQ